MRLKTPDPNNRRNESRFADYFCDNCHYGIRDNLVHADGNWITYEYPPGTSPQLAQPAKKAKPVLRKTAIKKGKKR
jgi:hypothetical protein